MEDLNDLYYFARVVENGGFAPAARVLGVPKSRLSRRIALLEERLGARLLQRTTRHFSVTELGQTYYEHCRAMLIEAEAAREAIEMTRAEPAGTVRMSCPVALLHAQVGSMLAEFMAAYPRVNVYLEATNRRVSPVSEAFDLAIRVRPGPLEDSDLVLRPLADCGQCLVASPALLAEHGHPTAPADLAHMPSLSLGPPEADQHWTLFGPDGAEVTLHHRPRLTTGDMTALRRAALNGIGIVQLPGLIVREDLDAGRLINALPHWAPRRELIHIVYPSRRCMLPSVRTLIDCLVEGFSAFDEGRP